MAGNASTITIGSVAAFINGDRGKNYPSQGDRVATGIPFINAADLIDGVVCFDSAERITQEAFDRLSSGKTNVGDIIFCLRGSPGRVARNTSGQAAIASSLVILRPYGTVSERYLYYMLSSPAMQVRCDTLNNGSAQPNVSAGSLKALQIELPPLAEQQTIASILGSLDDKIELNRRMNETLEAMARAIFKSWFVDFDPVRAKADGRRMPGLAVDTMSIFPDSFQDSPLGKVPNGWKVVPLPDVIEVNPRRALPKGTPAPYVEMKNLPTSSARVLGWEDRPLGSGAKFANGDVLLARITPCLENGKTAFVDFLTSGQVSWGSTEYIVLHAKPPIPAEYAYFLARMDDFRAFAIQNMTGTSGRQRVDPHCFDHYAIAIPPADVAQRFGDFTRTAMAAMKANDEQSATLRAMRDGLLPKLLSGEIHVTSFGREQEDELFSANQDGA